MDGLPGIYIPGAISGDIAKQTAGNSFQLMKHTSLVFTIINAGF